MSPSLGGLAFCFGLCGLTRARHEQFFGCFVVLLDLCLTFARDGLLPDWEGRRGAHPRLRRRVQYGRCVFGKQNEDPC
jgi:hypothetical protein